MDWLLSSLDDMSEYVLLQAIGVVLVVVGVGVVLYLRNRSYRTVRRRLVRGTPRDRMAGGGGDAGFRSVQQIDALVEFIGQSALAQDPANSKSLRARLRRAGFFSRSAFAYFIACARAASTLLAGCLFYGLALLLTDLSFDPLFAGRQVSPSDTSRRAFYSIDGSIAGRPNTGTDFPTSWTSWSSACRPASASKPGFRRSATNWPTDIRL